MQEKFGELLYDTLTGLILEEYGVPGVENAYDQGGSCCHLYEIVCEARERLQLKMQVEDGEDDPDVLMIINTMEKIQRIIALQMFEYGQQYQ